MSTTTLSDRETLETIGAAAGSLLGTAQGELVLRMTNGPHAGRIVRLSSSKCSIGSAADCTLRLRGAGLDPVHCVILRGARQTIVRRWSGDTRLNDRGFEDMPLQNGDRLAVGPIEMQVVAVPGALREVAQAARRLDLELASATSRLTRLTERLDLANNQGRRRLRAVLAKLRKYQLRLTEVESRRSRLTQEQEELANGRAQLEAERQTVERRRGELEQETRRLAESEGNVAARRAELERRTADLLDREVELAARARELTDRTTAFAGEQARLQTAQAELAQQNSQHDDEARRLAALEADVAARHAELERRMTLLADQAADLSAREQALEDRAAKLAAGEQSLAVRETTLTAHIDELNKQAAELTRREAVLTDRESGLTRRESGLTERESGVAQRESTIAETESQLTQREQGLTRREAEIAARCQSLKNHWTLLTQRETTLERERTTIAEHETKLEAARAALADQEAKLQLDRTALAERELAFAERPAPAPIIETKTVVDTAALERAEQLQQLLDEARAELAASQVEQARREAELEAGQVALRESQAALARAEAAHAEALAAHNDAQSAHEDALSAEKLDLADRRAAVEAEAADVTARRATVELAARTVEKWSALVEEWSAAIPAPVAVSAPIDEMANAEPAAPTENPVNEEMAAALEQAEQRLLHDRLEIEKLEAELKTWRDEAKHWKSRFDEASIAPPPVAAAPPVLDEVAESTSEPIAETTIVADEHEATEASPAEQAIEITAAEETAALAQDHLEQEQEVEAEQRSDVEEEPLPEVTAEHAPTESVEHHEAKSESAADVLRRLGLTAAFEEDSAADGMQQRGRPTPPPPPAPAPKPVAAEHHEGEESLDAYMQQLFQRLGVNQGNAPAPEAKPQPQSSPSMASPSRVVEPSKTEQPAAPPPAPLPLLQPGEFKARSSAAERRSDLSALRELANFQAKTAITKNQIVRKSSNSKGKLTIGILAAATGLYCAFAYFVQGSDNGLYGMVGGLVLAALHLAQSIRLKISAKNSARSLDDVIQKTAERGATKQVGT